jgi:hypothetical protein
MFRIVEKMFFVFTRRKKREIKLKVGECLGLAKFSKNEQTFNCSPKLKHSRNYEVIVKEDMIFCLESL